LLARLHLDIIMGELRTTDVRKALEILPKRVDDTYREAMERIERQADNRRDLAKRVLMWISSAFCKLTIQELQHALAVEPHMTRLDPEDIFKLEIIISVCAGLVVIDEERKVRLVRKLQHGYGIASGSHFPQITQLISISNARGPLNFSMLIPAS
jgi:hypothetical protein